MPALLLWLAAASAMQPLQRFPIPPDSLTITAPAESHKPFTVAGPLGAVFGEQNGSFEAWLYPVKVLSQFRITARIADYPVPIDVNEHAAAIEVSPAETTITYSHAAFTIKQRMFAPRPGSGTGAVILFEIAAVRPMDLTFRFKPDLQRMWPAPSFGRPSPEWVSQQGGGYYILHTDDPSLSAVVAMPRAQPGILPPYQERPEAYPVELRLHFDPKTDSDLLFPLAIMMRGGAADPGQAIASLIESIPALYAGTESYYRHFFDGRLSAETPDPRLDRSLRWAEISIDQGQVLFHGETGLVAGYGESGDSARPGFAWFFGRDSLWTSYAINGYGDLALTRRILEFLIRRQRADGKIMHEFSQTADLVDWKSLPYFYAEADSTPLLIMAMDDYVATSGDLQFLRGNWDAVKRAYAFTQAHDSDGDGIYENTEGTGWVESWPPGMPHQEIYLAALDQQAADAFARLAVLMHDDTPASAARLKAQEIRAGIETEYFDPKQDFYAFSKISDGSRDNTATIFPAVAWWTGHLALQHPDRMLDRWASPEFSTDWGTRDLSDRTPFYDPISYHQGSVWPLFTGWVSLAEYRAGRALSGYQHLMQNVDLAGAQDLGAVTELLSGAFFQPLGRSTPHQVWSSAMVISPALRGLFGLEWDAMHHTLRFAPNLPASWDRARLRNVPLGGSRLEIDFVRTNGRLEIQAHSAGPEVVCLAAQDASRGQDCTEPASTEHDLDLPLPPVEFELPHNLPLPGSETAQPKVVSERQSQSGLELVFAAPGGSSFQLRVRLNNPGVRITGADLAGEVLSVRFPVGPGYQRARVEFAW